MPPRIAAASTVDRSELLDFLGERHHAVLVTGRRDGNPQLSPITCGVDESGSVMISSYPQRAKVHNIRRDPSVSLCVLSADWDGPWVQLDGNAEVIDLPDALEPLVSYYRSISGEHPDWEEYRTAMRQQGKCLIRIVIRRWGPVATGGFPPELRSSG
ncbi:MAG: PPOX class F420-dependent oxidoreductase [Geodermatophilaceae bacterium]|nr:PPOX class F420-dependent oxidoreductase [Geodermatophilaceae bacterium]